MACNRRLDFVHVVDKHQPRLNITLYYDVTTMYLVECTVTFKFYILAKPYDTDNSSHQYNVPYFLFSIACGQRLTRSTWWIMR